MSERHFRSDPPSASEIAAVNANIDSAIALASTSVPITQAKTVIAVAGTATTVAAAALGLTEYDRYAIHLSRIPYEKVKEVSDFFSLSIEIAAAALVTCIPDESKSSQLDQSSCEKHLKQPVQIVSSHRRQIFSMESRGGWLNK
jgi:exopolyphosphatase/pppGpp-phosphohydrolase